MSTKVSICVPVYNGEPFIRQTIEMILSQEYDNMEVLVSDNDSTDNTVGEINKIKDERVRIIQNSTNVGMGGNWNILMKEATGDYLMIVCADDFLLPGAVKAKAKVLDENSDVSIVFSSAYVMSEKGKKIMLRRPFKGNQWLEAKKTQKELFVKKNFFAEPTNNMLRRDAVLKTGEFDNNLWYTIDWEYWLRILNTGNAYYIDKPYSGFRISGSSATGSSLSGKEKILKDEAVFMDKHKDGKYIPITPEMIEEREKNVKKRLNQKVLFMKILTVFSKFIKR